MSDSFKNHGAFSWIELQTSDPAGAKEFYSKLLGWQFDEMESNMGPYASIKANDVPVGGIMKVTDDSIPPHWGAYITVDNVDEVVDKATGLNAKTLIPPTDIPDVGRFSLIQDPQGATVSVISYNKDMKS